MEWNAILDRPWTLLSSLPNNSWIVLLTFLTSSQNTHQCLHVCAPQQGNPTTPPQRHPLQLRVKEMPTNILFFCLSHYCPFETTIFVANVLHQKIVLGLSMPSCIKISFTLKVKKTHFETPLQTAFATRKLIPSPRFLEGTIMNQWWIKVVRPQFIWVLNVGFISMPMNYHSH